MMTAIDVRQSARTAADILSETTALVEPALRSAVETLPTSTRHVVGYHFGWWDAQGGLAATAPAGKLVRPALVLLTARANRAREETALRAATAVELVHNSSLLHDDVIDHDHTRRHRPTAWKVFGIGDAILAGDALLALAADVLSGCDAGTAVPPSAVLNRAVQDLLEGQCLDLSLERRTDVGLGDCEEIARAKTAALMGAACAVGGAVSGCDAERVGCYRRFGVALGLAFQQVDDLLGIWGDPAVTGKPAYSDLRNRKKSLPVVYALTSGTSAGRALTELFRREEPWSRDQIVRAAELVQLAGGGRWSRAQADARLAEALRELRSAVPDGPAAAELITLARFVVRRDH